MLCAIQWVQGHTTFLSRINHALASILGSQEIGLLDALLVFEPPKPMQLQGQRMRELFDGPRERSCVC